MGKINATISVAKDPNNNNAITATAPDIDVPKGPGVEIITFDLSVASDIPNAANYKFPDDNDSSHPNNGVDITSGGSEFYGYNKLGNGKVQVTDKNDNTDTYTYCVTVLDPSGNPIVSDPSIRNGGQN